jgi:RNA polymerase sigma factor (sigma-70 family)
MIPSSSAASDSHGTKSDLPAEFPVHADIPLWEAICAGGASALEELFVVRCGRMTEYLGRKYGFRDLPGELLLHLREDDWRRLRTWKGRSSLKTWVEQVAIHLCLKYAKETNRFKPLEHWNELEDATRRAETEERSRFSRLDALKAMNTLRNTQERNLLVLHILQGLPIAEAAGLMGITRGNADVVKHRAIRHMREALGVGEVGS